MVSNKMKGVVSLIDKNLDTITWNKRMQSVKSSKTARQSGNGTEVPKSSFTKHVRSIIASLIEDGILERGKL